MSFTGALFIEEGLLTGKISDDVFLVNSCQVLQFLAKDHRFEGQVMLTCFCRFVCLPFRNMYILKMMCTYNICEIKKIKICWCLFRWCRSARPNSLPCVVGTSDNQQKRFIPCPVRSCLTSGSYHERLHPCVSISCSTTWFVELHRPTARLLHMSPFSHRARDLLIFLVLPPTILSSPDMAKIRKLLLLY